MAVDALPSLETQKRLLRQELRQKLDQLKPAERVRRGSELLGQLLKHPKFVQAKTFLSYVGVGLEVETWPLVEEALRRGKRVFIPRVDEEKKKLWMIEITGKEELRPSRYGILEPAFRKERLGDPATLELAVIPGLGFDRQGGRLGRGGGYFDRFLREAMQAYKIGLAFECQLLDSVPQAGHDVRVDEVLTA
jgi:5-formyltetrahydrofolate cyclo-ligase